MYPKPLFWHSGQFLEPQHFQETDRYHLHGRGEILRLVRPCFHGVVRLGVSPAALAEGTLSFDEAELFFPDGTHVVWNGRQEEGNASPLRRPLPEMEDGTLAAHARLDRFRARRNAAGLDKTGSAAAHPERYDACPDEHETPDRYAQQHPTLSGDGRILTRLNHNVRILWGSELGDGAGGMTLPLLRLIRRDGAFAVDADFIPPLATIHGSDPLVLRLRRFMRLLSDFPRRMENAAGSAVPSIDEMFICRSAARLLSDLDALLAWDRASPWEVHRALRAACAEMSAAAPLPGGGIDGIPRYDHDRPDVCFPALITCAERLLSRFLPEELAVVAPEYSEGMLIFHLPEAASAPGVSFRLELRSDEEPDALLREGRLIAGSPDAVRDAVRLALPKVPLAVVPAPRGLPSGDGVRYLAPGGSHPAWKDVLAARRLAVAYYPRRGGNPDAERLASALRLHILRGGAL